MQIPRDGLSWGWCPLLLLLLPGLGMSLARAQVLSYQEAVLRAVDSFNQRSSDTNLFRLLALDSQPSGDDPATPQLVSFTVKETVCPKRTRWPVEQCDFKEAGLVKQCVGTVTLDKAEDSSDVDCTELQNVKLGNLFKKAKDKVVEKGSHTRFISCGHFPALQMRARSRNLPGAVRPVQ
ncbi:cathelicidin antimicrobial peptide [Ctenodactylus gundi]